MITNYNDSDIEARVVSEPSLPDNSSGARSASDVIKSIEKRRENAINGGVNCIPLPFKRFRREIPGIEQGQYVLVTANQKSGKSMITNYLYMYHVLDYCFEHKDQCSCHIIYFAPCQVSLYGLL